MAAALSVCCPHVLENVFSAGVKLEKKVFSAKYFCTSSFGDAMPESFWILPRNLVKDSPISRLREMHSIFFSTSLAFFSADGLPMISSMISIISAGSMMSSKSC